MTRPSLDFVPGSTLTFDHSMLDLDLLHFYARCQAEVESAHQNRMNVEAIDDHLGWEHIYQRLMTKFTLGKSIVCKT